MAQADIGNKLSDTRAETGDNGAAAQERLGDYRLPDQAVAVVEAADRELEAARERFRPAESAKDPDAELKEFPGRKRADGDSESPVKEQREKSPPGRYGDVKEPPKFVRKPPEGAEDEDLEYIEGLKPVSRSLRENLSQDALARDPDLYSTYEVTPQPDSGRGMQAAARVFHEREHARLSYEAEQATEDGASTDSDAAAPTPKTPIWAYTHHGLDVRDFKAQLDERDAALAKQGDETSVVDRTRAVIAVDSPEKLAALQGANLFGDWEVEYQLIDPERPEDIELPEGTGIALFPDTLDKLPAQQILQSKGTNAIMQIQEATAIADTDPLVRVDPETGQAHTMTPLQVGSSNTAEGAVRYDLMPQLAGKIIPDRGTYVDDQQLEDQEQSAAAFLARQPAALSEVKGTVFNWQQSLRPIVQQAAAGLRDDGLIFISGPMRDTNLGEPAFRYHHELDEMHGPIVSHVMEQSEIDDAVRSVARDAGSVAIGDRKGGYGYMFIDRAATTDDLVSEFITTELRPAFAPNVEGARLADELNEQRSSVALARGAKTKEGLAEDIKDRFDELVKVNPQSGRDYALVHEIAADLNRLGDYEAAREVAERAVAAAPHFSGGWVEIAKAEFGTGNLRGAAEALDQAIQINPRNAEIYKVAIDQRDEQEARKEQLLDDYHAGRISAEELRERADRLGSTRGYVGMVSEYLNVAPHLSNDARIEWLAKITEAQERDFRVHEGDASSFKTYVVQNLRTGDLEERHISADEALRIIAADTALKNAEAVAALRRQEGAEVGQINAAMDPFMNVYERLVPRGEDGLPLPRDEWADLPQSAEERWIYAGSMREGDATTEPSAEWHERVVGQQETGLESVEVSTAETGEFRMPERTRVEVGHVINPDGGISREVKSIELSLFNRHVFVSGASGTGKSEFIKTNVIENVALNSNVKTILIYMGDKDGEYDDLAARYGDNIRIQHWRPGAEDAEAVSVNLFNPGPGVKVQDHIDQFVAWWQRVYEGGDPFPQILNNALLKVYEANGWNNVTGERGELPTFDQLQEQIAQEVEQVEYQGEARNIKSYFETRNMRNALGQMGMFLETQNGSVELDWERAIDREDSDVLIVDLRSGFSNPDDRRNMGMAFDMKLRQAFQARGLARGEELRTLVIMDEAQQALRNAGDGEPNRRKAVEAYAQGFEQDRAYGVGRVIATPTEDIHPSVVANTAVQVRFALVSGEDVERATSSWLERRDVHARDLSTQQVGQAKIKERGKLQPTHVQMLFDQERARPTEAEVRAAVARQPALSTIKKVNAPERPYSHVEIEEARKQAESREAAWKYSTVGAVALSHVLAYKLPTQVAPQLREQWRAEVERNPRIAHLTMSRVVDKVVKERIGALRKGDTHIRSDVLGASIMAHTVALLEGDTGTSERVSPAFGFLPARIGMSYRQLTAPAFGTAPQPKQLAVPLPFRVPQPVRPAQFAEYQASRGQSSGPAHQDGRDRVEDQVTRLQAYPASPVGHDQIAKDRAGLYAGEVWNAVFGHDGGDHLWNNQRYATQGVVDELQQRALIATQLGYKNSPYYPQQSEFEAGMTLPGFLRQHINGLRQEAEQAYQRQ